MPKVEEMAQSKTSDLPRLDQKKNFDLEIVLDGFQKCTGEDGSLIMTEYIKGFCELCRFFRLTGKLFGFVAKDLEWKVGVINKRAGHKTSGHHYITAQSMIEYELQKGITHQKGHFPSGCRTLIRLQRALKFIIEFMTELRNSSDDSKVSHMAWGVYKRTLSQYHIKIIRGMASVAVHMLPTRRQMFELMVKQDPETILVLIDKVVETAQPVYDFINELLDKHGLSVIP